MKILLTSFLLLLAFQVSFFGQEKPQPRLIDEFSEVNCEEFLNKMDALFFETNFDQTFSAYVLIYSNPNNLDDEKKKLRFKGWVIGAAEFRGFDTNRISVVNSQTNDSLKVQFWIVLAGTELPVKFEKIKTPIPNVTKPKLYHQESLEGEICSSDELKTYAEILKNNTQLQGNIVIYDFSNKRILETQNYVITRLIDRYKVPRNQLKFFHIKSNNIQDVEYWLVPKRKKS